MHVAICFIMNVTEYNCQNFISYRACPECRMKSDFVTPSKYWVDTKEEKEKLIRGYKKALGWVWLIRSLHNYWRGYLGENVERITFWTTCLCIVNKELLSEMTWGCQRICKDTIKYRKRSCESVRCQFNSVYRGISFIHSWSNCSDIFTHKNSGNTLNLIIRF